MNKIKAFKTNLIYALIAQTISLLLSLIISFIVPKFLGVEEFGYWQLFVFYSSYVNIAQLGISDGLYLRLGGENYKDLDFEVIGSQFKIFVIGQVIISGAILLVSTLFIDNIQRKYILIAVAIYLFLYNISRFIGFIFQAVNKTKEFSITSIIDRSIVIISVFIILILNIYDYKLFIGIYLLGMLTSLIYSVYKGREIVFCRKFNITRAFYELKINITIGIKLLISNFASVLIIGISRFLIDSKWGISVFGKISFALSLTNFFLLFINQVSMVLFPTLRQIKGNMLEKYYEMINMALGLILPIIYLLYLPLQFILSLWLPQYQESFKYLALLLPICIFDGKMQMLCNTYFKVLRKENALLIINIISFGLSFILSIVGIFIFENLMFIIISIVIVIAIRSIISEIYLSKSMKKKKKKNILYEILLSFIFVVLFTQCGMTISFIGYSILYILYIIINKNNIKWLINISKDMVNGG